MEHVFWLYPGEVAGRPGPIFEPWDLPELRAGGIGAILSVAEEFCEPWETEAAGIERMCVALPNCAPPPPECVDFCAGALPGAVEFIDTQIARGRAVMIHCAAGKDRTGLVMAYYAAVREGLGPEAAIARVRDVRPIALTAQGWEDLTFDLIAGLNGGARRP